MLRTFSFNLIKNIIAFFIIFGDKKDLIKKNRAGTADLYYINSDDPVFYKTDTANKFNDNFLIANNKEILNNVKLLTEYFKKLS